MTASVRGEDHAQRVVEHAEGIEATFVGNDHGVSGVGRIGIDHQRAHLPGVVGGVAGTHHHHPLAARPVLVQRRGDEHARAEYMFRPHRNTQLREPLRCALGSAMRRW